MKKNKTGASFKRDIVVGFSIFGTPTETEIRRIECLRKINKSCSEIQKNIKNILDVISECCNVDVFHLSDEQYKKILSATSSITFAAKDVADSARVNNCKMFEGLSEW